MAEQGPSQIITPEKSDSVPAASPIEAKEPTVKWQFNPVADEQSLPAESRTSTPSSRTNNQSIHWSASEFVAHQKSFSWFVLLTSATTLAAAAVFFLTRDKISTGVIVGAAIVLGLYARREPRTLEYHLDETGLGIGQKFYAYDSFKSFAILNEGAFSSITLTPLRRFSPTTSIYYAPEDEEKIITMLANRLPLEDSKNDIVDSFMRRIRF